MRTVKLGLVFKCGLVGMALLHGTGCGTSASPTAPTPPVSVTPPPVVIAPPPAPTITSYAGRWFGEYVVVQCSGSSGSMGDVLCSSPRPGNGGGIFQPNSRLPITIDLAQSGSAVNGALSLGSIRGAVTGSVLNQHLILSGTAIYSDASAGLTVTNVITTWDTAIVGDLLTGDFSLSIKVNIFPGDGVVQLRLQNTRR